MVGQKFYKIEQSIETIKQKIKINLKKKKKVSSYYSFIIYVIQLKKIIIKLINIIYTSNQVL